MVTLQPASAATLAETLPSSERISEGSRADQEVIDAVGAGELDDGVGRIDALQHVHREPRAVELQRLGPMAQAHKPVDLLAVAAGIERRVDREAMHLIDVDAGEPRGR